MFTTVSAKISGSKGTMRGRRKDRVREREEGKRDKLLFYFYGQFIRI
jgi:hypothetical protein